MHFFKLKINDVDIPVSRSATITMLYVDAH